MSGKKTIFFDRDGTLIIDMHYLNDPEKIFYLEGVFDALGQLRDAGFQFVIVTNQAGIAKGLVSHANLEEIHRRMIEEFGRHGIKFAGIYFAPQPSDSDHPMRKPNPGMLLEGARDHEADLARSWMIGDRMSDIEAGHRAGCRTILLDGTDIPSQATYAPPTFVARDVLHMAEIILANDRE
jgi:histidinol-phosphate phosphatase family protein